MSVHCKIVLSGFLISCDVMSMNSFRSRLVSSATRSLKSCRPCAHFRCDMSVIEPNIDLRDLFDTNSIRMARILLGCALDRVELG